MTKSVYTMYLPHCEQPTILITMALLHYLPPSQSQQACKGPPIYDVRTEGGGGLENQLILQTNSTDRLREMWTKGGRGGPSLKVWGPLLWPFWFPSLADWQPGLVGWRGPKSCRVNQMVPNQLAGSTKWSYPMLKMSHARCLSEGGFLQLQKNFQLCKVN